MIIANFLKSGNNEADKLPHHAGLVGTFHHVDKRLIN